MSQPTESLTISEQIANAERRELAKKLGVTSEPRIAATLLDELQRCPGTPRPIRDQVLVRYEAPSDRTESGLLFKPEVAFDKMDQWGNIAQVVSVGPDVIDCKPGDRVVFKRRGGTALNPDSREVQVKEWTGLLMLRCPAVETAERKSDIMAVLGE